MLICLAVVIFPFAAVVALCTFPLIMLCPCLRVIPPSVVAGQKIRFHISGMVSGVVPECTCLGFMLRLPVIVHFAYHIADSLGFFGRSY